MYRHHSEELDSIKNEQSRYDRLVELNVEEQCINVLKMAEVQRAYRHEGLRVHGWVFDMRTGNLIDLKIKFDAILEELMKVYRLNLKKQ